MDTKNILLISQQAPYGSSASKDFLDAALAFAAYDQDISLLFLGDAVYQLLKNQQPEQSIGQKNLNAQYAVLPMYDIEKVFVDDADLKARGLTQEHLAIDVALLDQSEVQALIHNSDVVLTV